MTYWKEKTDTHIRFAETDVFQTYPCISGRLNEFGYVDAPLAHSKVLYFGTCDIMSSIDTPDARWASRLHRALHNDIPFMTIGSTAAGLPSQIRRLYAFIQNYDPPERIYMTVARFEGYEGVNKSGKCYNINSRVGTPQYLNRRNLLTEEEFNTWCLQIKAYKELYNIENNRYILEERFAFIETLCKAYNIELRWTFNPSDACIVALYRNISIFENISDFMKKSFVGLVEIVDSLKDRSIGSKTHNAIFEKFMGNEGWDFQGLHSVAQRNFEWLQEHYGTDLIKNED